MLLKFMGGVRCGSFCVFQYLPVLLQNQSANFGSSVDNEAVFFASGFMRRHRQCLVTDLQGTLAEAEVGPYFLDFAFCASELARPPWSLCW